MRANIQGVGYMAFCLQVLMLDADNQLLVSPDILFNMPEYKQHGAVFWPDYWTAGAAEEVSSYGKKATVYEHDGRHSI